ncbi:hypothetical protein CTI14_33620 [Methylobacterium radiotolerans]|nr:hypothetical protein CTI14_33620 [Methylobacterium radiotolerans]
MGRGNTSQVYLASDPDGQRVALKLPHDSTLQHQEAAERFGNEVRLTLQLRHPHLVRGYAGMPFGTQAFLSMRYYPGAPRTNSSWTSRNAGCRPWRPRGS